MSEFFVVAQHIKISLIEKMHRGGRGYRGRGPGRFGGRGERPVVAKDDADGIPILRPGKNGNYSAWIKALSKAAGKMHGDLARLYKDDEYYIPPLINYDDIYLNDPWKNEDLTV